MKDTKIDCDEMREGGGEVDGEGKGGRCELRDYEGQSWLVWKLLIFGLILLKTLFCSCVQECLDGITESN